MNLKIIKGFNRPIRKVHDKCIAYFSYVHRDKSRDTKMFYNVTS